MSPTGAVRRLLKSRLRLQVLRGLAAERPHENWDAVLKVEEGIEEDAWDAWLKVRASFTADEISGVLPQALKEAVSSVEEGFSAVHEDAWLKQQVEAFAGALDVTQLMGAD